MIDRANANAKQYAGHWREPYRALNEPSRNELRELLAEAARNTAAIQTAVNCTAQRSRHNAP
jgi:hypothetical protein